MINNFKVIGLILFVFLGIFLIGFILGKTRKNDKGVVTQLFDLFKFILTNEFLSPPGKVNFCGGILVVFACIVMAFPLLFSMMYKMFFGVQLIDVNLTNYVIIYFCVCAIPLSVIEAIIYYKKSMTK